MPGRPVADPALVLAQATADAINPERPSCAAMLGNALLLPLMTRVVELLAERGYRIERVEPDPPGAVAA